MTKNEIKYFSKLKQKKYRDEESKFLIEGEHLIIECIKSKYYKDCLIEVFVSDDFLNETLINFIKKNLPDQEITVIDPKSFLKLTETVNPQGILGVIKRPEGINNAGLSKGDFIVALDAISDPGNLGTILRTCYWFGAGGVRLGNNCAELFNSKVIRSSQGAMFNLNIKENINLPELLDNYSSEKTFEIILMDLKADTFLHDFKFNPDKEYVFVFGNESIGINDTILDNLKYRRLKIKDFTNCESLNVSISAGVVLNTYRTN